MEDPAAVAAAIAGAIAFSRHAAQLQVDARLAACRWAPIACSCPPWWSWEDRTPPQLQCSLHGTMIITADGTIL